MASPARTNRKPSWIWVPRGLLLVFTLTPFFISILIAVTYYSTSFYMADPIEPFRGRMGPWVFSPPYLLFVAGAIPMICCCLLHPDRWKAFRVLCFVLVVFFLRSVPEFIRPDSEDLIEPEVSVWEEYKSEKYQQWRYEVLYQRSLYESVRTFCIVFIPALVILLYAEILITVAHFFLVRKGRVSLPGS